jgi:hypothetical protein
LELSHSINNNGDANNQGGITINPTQHATNSIAVEVEGGGEIERNGTGLPGINDQVQIGGTVYNFGATVQVIGNSKLNITGKDQNGNCLPRLDL